MGGRDHSCEGCGRGGFNDPDGQCTCGYAGLRERLEALPRHEACLPDDMGEVLREHPEGEWIERAAVLDSIGLSEGADRG